MTCYVGKTNPELCLPNSNMYSALEDSGKVFILCGNCVARWVVFGRHIVAFEKIKAVDFR
jgi:hypothetical protein